MANLADWRVIDDDREKYAAYLCSRDWAVLKEAVHKRAGERCERCRVFSISAVHHLTYERKYQEELMDLAGWCKSCHDFTHGKSDFDPAADDQETKYLKACIFRKFGGPPLFPDLMDRVADGDSPKWLRFFFYLRSHLSVVFDVASEFDDDELPPGIENPEYVAMDLVWNLDKALGFNITDLPTLHWTINATHYRNLYALFGFGESDGR